MKHVIKKLLAKPLLYGSIAFIAVISVASAFIFKNGNGNEGTLIIAPGEFVNEVSVSGKVIAAESAELGFSQSGRVSGIFAKIGEPISAGTVIASIENDDLKAELLQKEATLEAEKAELKDLEQGTRPEELAISEADVTSAKVKLSQTNITLYNSIQEAYTKADDAVRNKVDQFINSPRSSNPTLNFSYSGPLKPEVESGRVYLENLFTAWKKEIDALIPGSDVTGAAEGAALNLNQVKLFLDKVALILNSLTSNTSLSQTTIDSYRSDVSTARTNVNAAITSLTSAITDQNDASADLITAENNLKLDEAGATAENIAGQAARVKAATADVLSAKAKLNKSLIIAPFRGIVTKIDIKLGEIAPQNTAVLGMISTDNFQIESFVPEINISNIKLGDEARITLDAYGEENIFMAKIFAIDPAETIRSGVSTYRIKLQFKENDPRIKSGMTANVLITTERKLNVIVVPQGIVFEKDGLKFVKIKESGEISDRKVEVGKVSSLGQIEIISGLNAGERALLNPEE